MNVTYNVIGCSVRRLVGDDKFRLNWLYVLTVYGWTHVYYVPTIYVFTSIIGFTLAVLTHATNVVDNIGQGL